MEKHFEDLWKLLPETERSRSNTIPGSPESIDEMCATLVRPHSLELFGMHRELSERFGNRIWRANNDRTNTWPSSHNAEDLNLSVRCNTGSPKTTQIKDKLEHSRIDLESEESEESEEALIEQRQERKTLLEQRLRLINKLIPKEKEQSESQPTEKSVNQSAEQSASQSAYNKEFVRKQIEQMEHYRKTLPELPSKEELDEIIFGKRPTDKSKSQPTEKSVNQPTEESANQQKQESLNDRPVMKIKFRIPDDIRARREKNESNITPIKKPKNYQDIINDLRPIVPNASRNFMIDASSPVVSAVDDCKHEPQTRHSEKSKKNGLNTPKKMKKRFARFFKYYMILLLSTTLVLFSAWLYEIQENRKHSSDFATAVVELKKRIYGQDQALEDLCEYLQHDVPSSKVIILVGGTGVGKSYTVDIIKKNFPRQYAIRQYFPPIEAVRDSDILPFIYPNLIILENLKEHDVQDVIKYLKTREDKNKNRFVTVLLVFNVDDSSMLHSQFVIRNSFRNVNIEAEIFSYQPLREDALEMCIMDGIIESKLTLTKKQFDLVKRNLLINGSGCKGAYRQVQIIGRQKWN